MNKEVFGLFSCMISNELKQDVDFLEVWIEFDPLSPHHFGTLYLFGEINLPTENRRAFPLKKIGHSGSVLILDAPCNTATTPRRREVFYSEPVADLDQYKSVHIYAGQNLVVIINEIEMLI